MRRREELRLIGGESTAEARLMVSGDEEIEHGHVCDWACGGNEVGLQFGAVVDAMKTPREGAGTPAIRGGEDGLDGAATTKHGLRGGVFGCLDCLQVWWQSERIGDVAWVPW